MPEEPGTERRSRRSRLKRRLARIPHPHLPHLTLSKVRILRLFTLLFVFSLLVLYGVFRSARFQELLRVRAEHLLTDRIGRPVSIGGFDLRLVPFAFAVRDVAIANDARGLRGPCFSAEEISLYGRPDVGKDHVRLPKVRVVAPRVVFEVFEDGTSNFSAILAHIPKTRGGGVDLRVEEALVSGGTFRFRELSARLDVLLRDAAVTAIARPLSPVTKLSLASRHAQFRLEDGDVLDLAIAADATLSPNRLHVDALRIRSDRLDVDASGGIEDLRTPIVALAATAATTGAALRGVFGLGLPIEGPIASSGTIRIASREGFRIRGRFALGAPSSFGPFPMTGTGSIRVDSNGLLAHLERGLYAGGEAEAFVRLTRLKNAPLPVKLLVKGRDLDFERFLGDLDLPGTGLMARADVDTTLTFGRGGIEHADGAGQLRLRPSPGARSMVAGRRALPTSGGGPLSVRDGKILLARMPLVIGATETAEGPRGGARVQIDGTLAFGTWQPTFDFDIAADDLGVLEGIADNFYPAIQKRPLAPPLRLGGSGRIAGRFERSFGDPLVSGHLEARDFALFGVRFGSSSGDFVVDRNVLTLSPFSATDSPDGVPGRLTLTGKLGWGGALRDSYRLEALTVDVDAWPIERIFAFLDFDLPITGRVTGRLPLDGVTPRLTGSAPIVLSPGSIWGQKVERMAAVLAFEQDRLHLGDVVASVAGGVLEGSGFYRFADKAYEFEARAKDLPLEALASATESLPGVTGHLSGRVSGSGTLDAPGLEVEGSLAEAAYEGKPLGEPGKPVAIVARVARGEWTGSVEAPGAAKVSVETLAQPARGAPRTLRVSLDVQSLAPYRALLALPEGAALAGSLAAQADLTLEGTGPPKGEGAIARADVVAFGRRISVEGPARFTFDGKSVRFARLVLGGGGAVAAEGDVPVLAKSALTLSGSVGLAAPRALDVSVGGGFDAALLKMLLPEAQISGRVALDAKLSGTLERPVFLGRVVLDGVDFAASEGGAAFESISGTLTLSPGRVSAGALSLVYAGGTVDLGGVLTLDGASLTGIRINAHLTRVRSQPMEGLRATVSGDLVLLGDSTLRTVRGELVLDRAVYDADANIGLGTILGRLRAPAALPPPPTRFDSVALDVRILAPLSSIEVRNDIARLRASGELVARGTWGHPLLFGTLEAEEGGQLTLKNLRYEVLSARVLFSNPQKVEPYFELEARTNVKDYQVGLGLSGTPTRLVPRFTSDPPLSDAQIVSLLATGELPGTTTLGVPVGTSPVSTDESISSAARELIASLATEAVTSRTKQFFRLDRLQIDPVFVGSSFDAPRLTIGKSIGRDLSVTYSYKASTNQEQIIIVEYQLSSRAFLQGVRDETGVYSVDLKFRQRLR
ncbi:MAG TPA: translocation/assembly module TamB domain-containing protein [Thermoanaerobaculia bacterium]|nr:translocation/assembly module TamB domain-containing protein [Thermoanaerobaculia bacterium]